MRIRLLLALKILKRRWTVSGFEQVSAAGKGSEHAQSGPTGSEHAQPGPTGSEHAQSGTDRF